MTGDPFVDWLVYCGIVGFVLLSTGGAAAWLCREPIDRIEIIRWTFLGCFVVPLVQPIPGLPRYSVAVWRSPAGGEVSTLPKEAVLGGPETSKPTTAPTRSSPPASRAPMATDETVASPLSASKDTKAPATPQRDVPLLRMSARQMVLMAFKLGYLLAVFGFAVHSLRGWLLLRRIARRSRPAGDEMRGILASIGQRRRNVRLLMSDEIAAPLMWGLWRPTIILPSRFAEQSGGRFAGYGVAHEWSHVARNDYLTLAIANLARLTCYFQPLYWMLRRELLLCQDFLADAFAARQGASAEDYAEFLVQLARRQEAFAPVAALGILERRPSNLRRRVATLVQSARPVSQKQPWSQTMKIHATMCLLVVLLCGVRLSAQAQEEKKTVGAITYEGRVIDRTSGAAIEGAIVKITRSKFPDTKNKIETTEHKTDSAGKYRFTLPPEQASEPSLYLEAEAEHPQYQPMNRGGYGHGMIQRNLALGDPPFFAEIKLSHGELVTATVLNPDGTPAANVQVSAYTRAGEEGNRLAYELGAFQRSVTDERGQLKFIVPTPGDGVIYIYPKDWAVVAKRIGGWRGELSTIHLQKGERLKGRVLNAKGEPIPQIGVAARQMGGNAEVDSFVSSAGIGHGVYRGTMTDAEGRFELRPLMPLGRFELNAASNASDSSDPPDNERREWKPVAENFSPVQVKIDRANPEPIEIRAAPPLVQVTVRGRVFNSKGEPCASHEQFFHGKLEGKSKFFKSNVPQTDGWFEIKVAKGLQGIDWYLSTHEHGSMRWRRSHDKPLTYGNIFIKELNEDWTTLEIVRYEAPTLLVKAVDEQGKPIADALPQARYKTRPEKERPSTVRFVGGMQGDVGFEKQTDGRWRSTCMLPDEATAVRFDLEGYACEPQTVSLNEGETKELVFKMMKLKAR